MSSVDYREKLRAMAQEERERMNDFILSEARRKEQKQNEFVIQYAPDNWRAEYGATQTEPEPVPEPTPAPVVVHEPTPAPVVVEPEPVVVEPVETPKPAPELEPKNKEIKKSFNFLADGDVREWLLYKRECGYNTSSLIKRVLREYMVHDMEWLAHIRKQVP